MDDCRHCYQPIRFYPNLGWMHDDGGSHCGGWDEPDTPRAEPGEDNSET